MAKEIYVTIDEEGNTQITVKGVKGESCRKLTKELEEALGLTTSDVVTAEFYEQPIKVNQDVKAKQ